MRVPPPGDAVPTERASGGPVEGHGLVPLDGCVLPLRPQSREARYYAAVHADTVQRGARAAMALADAEAADLNGELERMAEVAAGWKRLYDAAITAAVDAVHANVRAQTAEARIAAAEALHQPASVFDDPWCLADGRAWPCPTMLALRGEGA